MTCPVDDSYSDGCEVVLVCVPHSRPAEPGESSITTTSPRTSDDNGHTVTVPTSASMRACLKLGPPVETREWH